LKGGSGDLSGEKIEELHGFSDELFSLSLSRIHSSICWQQSRIHWLREGDANSKFFHGIMSNRHIRNSISFFFSNGGLVEGVQNVRSAVFDHFSTHFQPSTAPRPSMEELHFRILNHRNGAALIKPFCLEDVKAAVWDCDNFKCPGPDGVNTGFIKEFWDILKDDMMRFLTEFNRNGRLAKGINNTFIALIPKVDSTQRLNDFRPISLVGSMYKILAKVLANRLRSVLYYVVSDTQSTFIKGRQILVANEIVDEAHRCKKELIMFKVDFEKTYDSIHWGYLDEVMVKMGFPTLWRKWIQECIGTSTTSVLVNGSPTDEFLLGRGLRQGDPLSPFLFLLVVEDFNVLMESLLANNLFSGYKVGDNNMTVVSHHQFADDTLVLGEKSWANIKSMRVILILFESLSGLKVNFSKSHLVGVNVARSWLLEAAMVLNCKVGSIPFVYLGLPIGGNAQRLSFWDPLITRIKTRLSAWKSKHLSLGGRLVLLNSVLSSLPVYALSFFKAPSGIISFIESILNCFFFFFLGGGSDDHRKITWVDCNTICGSKEVGGFGVRRINEFNIALLGNWCWRVLTKSSSLWFRVLSARYGMEGGSLKGGGREASLWWWDIYLLCRDRWFNDHVERSLGNGKHTLFWSDVWCGEVSFKIRFSRLFELSAFKEVSVFDMSQLWWGEEGEAWRWRLFTWEEEEVGELTLLLHNVHLQVHRVDRWLWTIESSNVFSFQNAYNYLTVHPPLVSLVPAASLWHKDVPLKVVLFAWRLFRDRLPKEQFFHRRGVLDRGCGSIESSQHLFLHCNIFGVVWHFIYRWLGISAVIPAQVQNHFN